MKLQVGRPNKITPNLLGRPITNIYNMEWSVKKYLADIFRQRPS